jgi:hypothetical protein
VQANPDKPWDYSMLFNVFMEEKKQEFYRQKHQECMLEVFNEFNCVFYHPDNIQVLINNCLLEGQYI